jgi:hypothetical protein
MNGETDSLINFVADVAGSSYLKIEEDLGNGFYRLRVVEGEKRQAKHDIRCVEDVVIELFRNARDAKANTILLAHEKEKNQFRKVVVIDDGCGIPKEYHTLIFEPRVTSRLEKPIFDDYGLHGRGMALFSIKSVVESIGVVSSLPGRGTAIRAVIDTEKIPEKKDQSTLPKVLSKRSGSTSLAGPNNIFKKALEFNITHPKINIYVGTPSEIAATLIMLYSNSSEENIRLPVEINKVGSTPSLIKLMAKLGLDISLRNVYRILSGEIKPVAKLIDWVNAARARDVQKRPIAVESGTIADKSSLRYIDPEDIQRFLVKVVKDFSELAQKYYIRVSDYTYNKRRGRLDLILYLEEDEGENF